MACFRPCGSALRRATTVRSPSRNALTSLAVLRGSSMNFFAGLAAGLLLVALAGCSGSSSASRALERQFEENPQFHKAAVAKFAGTVTIDGQPPSKDLLLFVILNDPQHLDENARLRAPKLSALCDDDGHFAFSTYDKGDGVAAGKYVVTFVQLHHPKSGRGARRLAGTGARHFVGPDELKNLYNDPDKNKDDPRFNLEVKPPGEADHQFDLAVAGKDPVTTPGANAVTTIISPR
jgi:hypothetical protein